MTKLVPPHLDLNQAADFCRRRRRRSQMRVVSVITLWSCDTCRCVSVRYDEPPVLAVDVWQRAATLHSVPCTNPEVVAAEADQLFQMYCDTPET